MTEEEARDWLQSRFGGREMVQLERFAKLLLAEAQQQSLIARSTFDRVWSRHIVDSAQLVVMAPAEGLWLDVGSGGGLPGIVVAILRDTPLVMVEPRRKRADFLRAAISELGCGQAEVAQQSIQNHDGAAPAVVSARAVASLSEIFDWTKPIVSRETLYLLPRGQNAAEDLEIARGAWHGRFHVEPSLTDQNSRIIAAREVARR